MSNLKQIAEAFNNDQIEEILNTAPKQTVRDTRKNQITGLKTNEDFQREKKEGKTHFGCYTGVSNEDYHASPEVSRSQITPLRHSVAHFLDKLGEENSDSEDKLLGRVAHTMVLEPETFSERCILIPEELKGMNKNKKEYKEWKASVPEGIDIVTPVNMSRLNKIVKNINRFPLAKKEISKGLIEYSFYWIDPESGIPCKCRPDILNIKTGVLTDFKTMRGQANEREFSKAIGEFLYHIQAAFYLDGTNAVLGTKFDTFQAIAAEKTGPCEVAMFEIDYMSIDQGRDDYKGYLMTLRSYLEARKARKRFKTGYEQTVTVVSIPHYLQKIS